MTLYANDDFLTTVADQARVVYATQMEHPAHQFSEGDRVRTLQRVGRLPAGSIGTIQTVFRTGDVLNVLFAGYRAPFLIYHDRLEAPPPQTQENE